MNLCSLKLIKTSESLVIKQMSLELWQINAEFDDSCMKVIILALNTKKGWDFVGIGSKLYINILYKLFKIILAFDSIWFLVIAEIKFSLIKK